MTGADDMTIVADRPAPHLPNAPNFRDLGGLPTRDGRRVAARRLYRSGAFTHLTDAEWDQVTQLGLRLFCDLRSPGERVAHPVTWPEPAPVLAPLSVLPDVRATGASVLQRLLDDGDGQATRAMLCENYAHMPHAMRDSLGRFFGWIVDAEQVPLLFACTAGQDRTGFLGALLLSALDVDRDCIMENYLESRRHFEPARIQAFIQKTLNLPASIGVNEHVLEALRVNADYLDSALGVIDRDFGGMARYLTEIGGLDDARRLRLQFLLLDA